MSIDTVNQFLEDVTRWASRQPDIHALALVGSHARNAARQTSDIDLVLIATRPCEYLDDRGWLEQFGTVVSLQVEFYGLLTSIRAWYADGREVEYGVTDERWAAVPLDAGSRRVMADGMRVLFERGAILSRHLE